jgi:outer membrane protein assembly factor BamB
MVRASVPLVMLLAGGTVASTLGSTQNARALTLPTTTKSVPPVTPPPPPAPQTVDYGYDAAHDFAAADPAITLPLGARWSVATNGDPVALLAADGVDFALVDTPSAAAPTGATIEAFDPNTGTTDWTSPAPINAQLAYDAGILAVAGGGHVQAFNYGIGIQAWNLALPGVGAITPSGGDFYANAAGGPGTAGTIDAINVTTGTLDWSAKPPSAAAAGPLAVAGDRVYRANSGQTQAFNRLTGALIWHQSTTTTPDTAETPTLWQTQLFRVGFTAGESNPGTTLDGGAIDAGTGAPATGAPAEIVSGGIGLETRGTGVVAATLSSDSVLWSSLEQPLAILNGDAITATKTGIQLRDLTTGQLAWTAQVSQDQAGVVTAVGNQELLIGAGGHVTALVPNAYAARTVKVKLATAYAVYGGAPARGTVTIAEPGIGVATPVSIAAKPFPYKQYGPSTTRTTSGNGTLALTERPTVDTIYRISPPGSTTALGLFKVVALPRVSYHFAKATTGRGKPHGEATVTLVVPSSIKLAHHSVSLYLGTPQTKRYTLLGTGTLTGGNGHFVGHFAFMLARHVSAKDFVTACFAGIYRLGMSFGDRLDSRCGSNEIGF